ncbi:MAG: NFACT RNA binding domain-containing protein [Myxococcota bacterium]|nr:NFACT RNA binding domain-containing protein [Myxococcota bacterium]
MTLNAQTLSEVVEELGFLVGGRIQRVDVYQRDLIVFEVRNHRKSFFVLVSGQPQVGRVHLIDRRPPKTQEPPNLQGVVRKWLTGKKIVRLSSEGRNFYLDVPQNRLITPLGSGKEAMRIVPFESVLSPTLTSLPEQTPCSDRIRLKYDKICENSLTDFLRRELLRVDKKKLDKKRRLLKKLTADQKKLQKLQAKGELGEILKANIFRVTRGMNELQTNGWHGEQVTIPLDPALKPQDNLEKLFRLSKKGTRGLPLVSERLQLVSEEIDVLERRLAHIETATAEELSQVSVSNRSGRVRSTPSKSKKQPSRAEPFRRFLTIDGCEVFVGKGAKSNDELSLKIAKGQDLWLHARGSAGAHVILKLSKDQDPPKEALLDACHLAAHYSERKNDAHVEIMYTRAKFVRKPKGEAPGRVRVSKDKSFYLTVDPARVKRLLSSLD